MCVGLEYKLFSRTMRWFDKWSYYAYMWSIGLDFSRWNGFAPDKADTYGIMRCRDKTKAVARLARHYKMYKLEQEIDLLLAHLNKAATGTDVKYNFECILPTSDYHEAAKHNIIRVMFNGAPKQFHYRGIVKFLSPYDISEIMYISEVFIKDSSILHTSDFGPRVCKMLIKCWCTKEDTEQCYPFTEYANIIKLYHEYLAGKN